MCRCRTCCSIAFVLQFSVLCQQHQKQGRSCFIAKGAHSSSLPQKFLWACSLLLLHCWECSFPSSSRFFYLKDTGCSNSRVKNRPDCWVLGLHKDILTGHRGNLSNTLQEEVLQDAAKSEGHLALPHKFRPSDCHLPTMFLAGRLSLPVVTAAVCLNLALKHL